MKRKVLFLLSLLLLGMVMGGCGKEKEEAGKVKEKAEEQKEELSESGLENYFLDSYEPSEFRQADVDSDTVQWICSAYAIYTHYNKKDLGCIGGTSDDNSEIYQRAIRIALANGWRISDRDSAIRQLNSLLEKGHRETYRKFISEMKKHNLLSLSEEELLSRVERENGDAGEFQAAYRAYQAMGEQALDAWDYSRALQVLGDCYQAEYISLEECLDVSLAVAKKLQEEFGSWDELCRSYLYGYHFWKKDDMNYESSDTRARWEVYEELKEMKQGPFSVPYDTELKESWKNVEVKKEEPQEESESGVYLLSDITDSITAEVKAFEEVTSDTGTDEHMILFDCYDETADSMAVLAYDISQISSEEDILYSIRLSLAMSEQNGAEDVEMGEIQTLKTGGWEIHYVVSVYKKDGHMVRKCNSWILLDDTYMLSCNISEDDRGGDFLYPEMEEMLKKIYGGIKRKE